MKATLIDRIARLAGVGVGLMWLTSCAGMSGFAGDDLGQAIGQASGGTGYKRVITGSNVGWTGGPLGNNVMSYNNAGKWSSSGASGSVRAYWQVRPFSDHGGFDPTYSFANIASSPAGRATLHHTVSDTSGDGYISSGAFTCDITSHVGNAIVPGAAFFQDGMSCATPDPLGPGFSSTASTEGSAGGYINMDNDPGGPNAVFNKLPFDLRVDLMNSVDTAKDVRVKDFQEIVTVHLTSIRINGQSYTPIGVSGDLIGFNRMILNPTPGMKLMVAWVANRLQESLDRGVKVRGSITVNNSVTVSLDQVPNTLLYTPNKLAQSHIDTLRTFAMRQGRGE